MYEDELNEIRKEKIEDGTYEYEDEDFVEFCDIEDEYRIDYLVNGGEKLHEKILQFAVDHKDWKDFTLDEITLFMDYEHREYAYNAMNDESDIIIDFFWTDNFYKEIEDEFNGY